MTESPHRAPLILGFNGSHDGSAALLRGGEILGTITSERVTRVKKCSDGNKKEIIERLLLSYSLSIDDLDYIAFCDNYLDPSNAFLKCKDEDGTIRHKSNIYGSLRPNCQRTNSHQVLYVETGEKKIPCFFINHHLGHVAYSYFTSNLDRAVCFSLDGSPAEYSLLALACENSIVSQSVNDVDISLVYDGFTFFTLGNPLYKAGSMMGLSAYGKPSDDFDLEELSKKTVESCWKQLTGREPEKVEAGRDDIDDIDMMVASTLQGMFEKEIIKYLNKIPDSTLLKHDNNLCLSGGSFLNCKLNGILKENTRFRNIHIPPACGDDGLSVGAALYAAHVILNLPRTTHRPANLMYSGPSYRSDALIGEAYDKGYVAKLLAEGKVVGFFQGRSEFGPRALGNRSLLADPRNSSMRKYLNSEIKGREWFRPFGASVLEERASNWFLMDCNNSPFMLKAYQGIQPDKVPAVTHIDGSSRIQTVTSEDNPRFYSLIHSFYERTSVPMILNTSLNDSKEPMVETPEDAIDFFKRTKVDALVLENRMLLKDYLA